MERNVKGIWIPIEIWEDKQLNALDKIILSEIDSLDGEEHCFASNEYFADFCDCTERTVSKSINKLIEYHYVEKVSFDGRTRILKSNLKTTVESNQGRKDLQSNMSKSSTPYIYNNNKDIIIDKIDDISSQENELKEKFSLFWKAYPKHTNTSKKETFRKFCKAMEKTDLQTMLDAIEKQKKTKQWLDERYIPMATTWLNQERWDDEVEIYSEPEEKPNKIYSQDDTAWKAANWLSRKLNSIYPTIKPLSDEVLQVWASVFERMETDGGHPPNEILSLMKYAFQNDFWQTKITSPWDLRRHYVKLLAQAEKDGWFN